MRSSILLGLQTTNRQRKTHSGQPLCSIDSWPISARTPRGRFDDYGTFWQVGRFNTDPNNSHQSSSWISVTRSMLTAAARFVYSLLSPDVRTAPTYLSAACGWSLVAVFTLLPVTHIVRAVDSSGYSYLGDCAFPVAAARAWNSLLTETRACSSLHFWVLIFQRETMYALHQGYYGNCGSQYTYVTSFLLSMVGCSMVGNRQKKDGS